MFVMWNNRPSPDAGIEAPLFEEPCILNRESAGINNLHLKIVSDMEGTDCFSRNTYVVIKDQERYKLLDLQYSNMLTKTYTPASAELERVALATVVQGR